MTEFTLLQQRVARALLAIGAVVFTPHAPLTFKSGIKSPVYIDNRRIPYWPPQWQTVIEGFQHAIQEQGIAFDIIAGVELAGISHSAALAYLVKMPSVFVRKEIKKHGTGNRIEGGDVAGKRVLLIEDLVTTGSSSLAGVQALREAGAVVEDCLCIISYGFPEAQQAFEAAHIWLHPLTPFAAVVAEAGKMERFGPEDLALLEAWVQDPYEWAGRKKEAGQKKAPARKKNAAHKKSAAHKTDSAHKKEPAHKKDAASKKEPVRKKAAARKKELKPKEETEAAQPEGPQAETGPEQV